MSDSQVDLRSDTVTQPVPGMREAMARAAVGDDVMGEDPTVNALQQRTAELFGKEAALFVPTGTMANLTAILAQTRPGDAIILSEDAHPYNFESANIAMVGGLLTKLVRAEHGVMTCKDVAAQIVRTNDHHFAPTTLVTVENTANRGGGAIYPIETIAAIGALAREQGLRFHVDGARIFNAVVETGVAPRIYASHADTLSLCLSKGLGCPAGSLVVGDAGTIDRVHRFRKMLGGGMRQAGILAAAGLYALDHHIDRLRDDHARARRFRDGIERISGLELPLPSPTNMVYVGVQQARTFAARLAEEGVRVLPTAPDRLRAVFHLDVSDEGVDYAVEAFRRVQEYERG